MIKPVTVQQITVCGKRSPYIALFQVMCTLEPDHSGDHKTIYSIDTSTNMGIAYSWPSDEPNI
jgi:hypothetical protein